MVLPYTLHRLKWKLYKEIYRFRIDIFQSLSISLNDYSTYSEHFQMWETMSLLSTELERAAEVLLGPPNLVSPAQRSEAEAVFLNFRKTKCPYTMCKVGLGWWSIIHKIYWRYKWEVRILNKCITLRVYWTMKPWLNLARKSVAACMLVYNTCFFDSSFIFFVAKTNNWRNKPFVWTKVSGPDKRVIHIWIKTRVSDPHFFFADPDPDPDPGGIRGRGLGVKGKMNFFLSFFHVSDDS